jgi:anti-sigma factor RsiW
MLPERITQLLTSYIDGELSSRQRKAVTRLLRKSPEARKLLAEMKQDSMVLRHLPKKKMKQDLSKTLPGTIVTRGIKLPPPPPVGRPAKAGQVPVWLVLVLGVLLLGLVGVGSYLFFGAMEQKPSAPATGTKDSAPATPRSGTPRRN